MMLKFRNGVYQKLFVAIFWTVLIILMCSFSLVMSSLAGQSEDHPMALKIFGCAFLCVWFLFFLSAFVFTKKVVVTKEKIVVKRLWRKIWSLDGNDIKECKCSYPANLYFNIPNERMMKFILKSTDDYAMRECRFGRYTCTIYLSVKNVKKMEEMGYNVSFPNR